MLTMSVQICYFCTDKYKRGCKKILSNENKKGCTKDIRLQFRFDKTTVKQLDECAKAKNTTRSEIVRQGIKKIHSELKK